MHTTFIQAFIFNFSAAFIYKIALLLHQIFLYSAISHHLYGQQSSLFAALYLLIALTNFGFDETLLPFFSIYSQSKRQCKQLLLHLYAHITITAIIAMICYATIAYGPGALLHNLQTYCNKNLIFLLTILFFFESVKKSIIAMMQLAFLSKQIAYAQVSMLLAYIVCVWSLFYWNGQLTLEDIFGVLLITSMVELGYLSYNFTQFYQRLSQETDAPDIPFKVFFKQRIFNYINQITKVVYSPNSMTLYFAYALGFAQAATIKFFTNIITLSYTCIAKSFGVTSGALFSSSNQTDIAKFFKDITYRYFQFLSILSCVMLSIVSYAYYTYMITQVMAWQILLFFSISFLEHVAITYEQLLMSQNKTLILACMNASSLTLLLICGYGYSNSLVRWPIILCMFIIIKIISLWAVRLVTRKHFEQNIQ